MTAPAPDLVAPPRPAREVTIRPLPRREPPFDDEAAALRLPDPRDGRELPEVVLGPWDRPLPFAPAGLDQPSDLRLVTPRDPFAARPTGRRALPDPDRWSRRLLTTMFEVLAGRRPARQLSALAAPEVCAGFTGAAGRRSRLAGLVARSPAPQIRGVRVCEPADGVAEVAVTLLGPGGRVRAVALRLEGLDGRWQCVELAVG